LEKADEVGRGVRFELSFFIGKIERTQNGVNGFFSINTILLKQ